MRSTVERFAQILVVVWSLAALESAGNVMLENDFLRDSERTLSLH